MIARNNNRGRLRLVCQFIDFLFTVVLPAALGRGTSRNRGWRGSGRRGGVGGEAAAWVAFSWCSSSVMDVLVTLHRQVPAVPLR